MSDLEERVQSNFIFSSASGVTDDSILLTRMSLLGSTEYESQQVDKELYESVVTGKTSVPVQHLPIQVGAIVRISGRRQCNFFSHNLSAASKIADFIAMMCQGRHLIAGLAF